MDFLKKLVLCGLLVTGLSEAGFSTNWIDDDSNETNTLSFHTYGLFSYGFHSNTFHLVNFFLRGDYRPMEGLDIFCTIRGYKDTHVPKTNYNYILDNLDLYDYGFNLKLFHLMFISMRGAAVYRLNTDSLLWIKPYYTENNAADFDHSSYYMPVSSNAAGIRVGFCGDNWEAGYSQGDFRHSIPSAVMARYFDSNWSVRATVQFEHANPLVYLPNDFNVNAQLSASGWIGFGDWNFGGLAEVTYNRTLDTNTLAATDTYYLRLEQAVEWKGDWRFALREIVKNWNTGVVEASVSKEFADSLTIGLHAATDGKYYIGSAIEF